MKKSALLLFIALMPFIAAAQSFKEKEVKRTVDGGTLYGTMLKAKNANGTVVIFISGSGPTDRDGNSAIGGKNNSLKMLATELGNKGYSSLRVDKRGIGKSATGFNEKDIRFDTYVNDIIDWTTWVKTNNKDVKKIVFIGHSEGSLIGMIAAQKTSADGYVSISGTGFPADSILKQQLEKQLPTKLYDETVVCLDSLKQGLLVNAPPKALLMLFRPDIQPYLISWFKYNPAVEIAKLTCPILIIQGLNDMQVSQADAQSLKNASPKAELLLLDKVTHVLKEAGPSQAENMETYKNETLPLSPLLVSTTLLFLGGIK
jgi:hypothetical protein